MISYCKNEEIDRVQWDTCIRNSHSNKPYGYSWYLDIMAPGWEALVDGDYKSVFPIPGRSLFGVKYIATPVFLQQLGAYSPDKPAALALSEFLTYLPGFYRFMDLCVGHKAEYDGYRVTEMVNFELDLSRSYETLRKGFSMHCLRNIETANKQKPRITEDISPSSLTDLFIKHKGSTIAGIKSRDYERLKALMQYCLNNKKGRILGVRSDNGELVYGMFLLETRGIKTMLFVVNSPESREKRIGYYMVDELIRQYASTRTVLDFAGSTIPSVASFMESFGAEKTIYYRLYRNRLLWPVRFIR